MPPKQEDVIYGRGSAKFDDLNMAITMAEARGRQAIAFTLNANVQAMITDYSRSAGSGADKSNLAFAETVGRQLTQAKLTGVEVENTAQAPDGTIYVLTKMRKADAAKAAANVIDSEAAKYAEFKAMDALKMMDAQLSKSDVEAAEIKE
jgi:hypothetical protein